MGPRAKPVAPAPVADSHFYPTPGINQAWLGRWGRRHAGFPGEETGSRVGSLFPACGRESVPARLLTAAGPPSPSPYFDFYPYIPIEYSHHE
jgi:hypothetical protein